MSNLVWRQSLATLACVLGLFAAAGRSSGASSSAGQTTTAAAAPGAPCESLRALPLQNGTVVSAQMTMPGTIVAAPDSGEREVVVQVPFCRVVGRIPPAINFEVWLPLPAAWNKRFQGVGNGGLSGFISYTALKASLERGYAVVGSDLGHTGKFLDARWAVNAPGLIADWGHRGAHEMTVAGKRVAQAFYGTAPQRAYFVGCSGGGRMALMEAQRYPEDYDGIVAGDPTNAFTRNVVGRLWTAFATLRNSPAYIPTAKLPMIADAVLKACDRIDGLADGIIDDPRRCHFDPAVLKCAGVVDGPQCLTTAQADTLKKVYEGPRNSRGEQLFPGLVPGGELAAGPVGWGETVLGNAPFTAIQFLYADNFFKWMVFENPKWDFRTFDYDRDVAFTDKKLSAHIDAVNPDLRPFKSRGGKIIHYHGWSDPGVSPLNSINYYESVVATMTHEQTSKFYRLFMVPGMAHCGGGPGPDEFDPLAAIQAWVENGNAPDRIVAVRRNRGAIERSRPLCPFPQVARWDGRGDVDRASSFGCVSPSPTR